MAAGSEAEQRLRPWRTTDELRDPGNRNLARRKISCDRYPVPLKLLCIACTSTKTFLQLVAGYCAQKGSAQYSAADDSSRGANVIQRCKENLCKNEDLFERE